MKNYNLTIPRTEILKLYSSTFDNISIHSISEWVKSNTERQFIVVERELIVELIKYIELKKYNDGFLSHNIKEKWDIAFIKDFIIDS